MDNKQKLKLLKKKKEEILKIEKEMQQSLEEGEKLIEKNKKELAELDKES